MFKGKIVQSTVEECRDAYAIWIDLAHESVKQRNLQKEAGSLALNAISNNQVHPERQVEVEEYSKRTLETKDLRLAGGPQDEATVNGQILNNQQDSVGPNPTAASSFIDSMGKLASSFRGQSQHSLLLVIGIALILVLMQISILVLLSKPPQIHVIPLEEITLVACIQEVEQARKELLC